jgi:hypothetical protein
MVLLGDEAQVDARLETVLIFTQHRCLIGPNVTEAQKSFWTHTVELLGEWVMWSLVLVRLQTVLVSVHGLRQTYHRLRSHFGRTRSYS